MGAGPGLHPYPWELVATTYLPRRGDNASWAPSCSVQLRFAPRRTLWGSAGSVLGGRGQLPLSSVGNARGRFRDIHIVTTYRTTDGASSKYQDVPVTLTGLADEDRTCKSSSWACAASPWGPSFIDNAWRLSDTQFLERAPHVTTGTVLSGAPSCAGTSEEGNVRTTRVTIEAAHFG